MFTLPKLPYDYDALEPYIDARTMQIHHQFHHGGYTNKLNAAIQDTPLEHMPIDQILEHVSKYPAGVRNNAGGYYNHNLFWSIMAPGPLSAPDPESEVYLAITRSFQTFENFMDEFKQEALNVFGSGWAWLCYQEPAGDLYVSSTPNQDNPLMDIIEYYDFPILGIDVWEHAYYLKYKNRRNEYIDAFLQIINWEEVNARYLDLKNK